MGISSSLNAGVSGLNANANKLATISDNIANSQTYGYKRADVDFSSLTVADAKSPNTIGGGRWFTAGGVKTNAIWDVDAKGAIAQTSNSTDLAVTGRGFLPVSTTASIGQNTAAMPFMLTTTGSFQTDAAGLPHHAVGPGAPRLAGGRQRRRGLAAARHRERPAAGPGEHVLGRGGADLEHRAERQPADRRRRGGGERATRGW